MAMALAHVNRQQASAATGSKVLPLLLELSRSHILNLTYYRLLLYLIHHLATSRVRVAGPQKGKRGQVRSEEAELAITTSFLRRTLSTAGVRAQSKLLLSRLEVIGPVAGAKAAAGRRSYALNLERRMANQRRADQLSRMQGKALLRRGQFKID